MLNTMLVPIDDSPLSEQAIPFAVALADRAGAEIVFTHAVQISLLPTAEALQYNEEVTSGPRTRLNAVVRDARTRQVRARWTMPNEEAGPGILAAAGEAGAELIVMATHARSGVERMVLGSVTEAVLRQATVPVMAVPDGARDAWEAGTPTTILVPLDGSPLSEQAIHPAGQLATTLGARVVLVRALEAPQPDQTRRAAAARVGSTWDYLAGAGAKLDQRGLDVTLNVQLGAAPQVISGSLNAFNASLIVMATHGRGGLSRLMFGSEAAAVVRQARVPVVLVGPSYVAAQDERSLVATA